MRPSYRSRINPLRGWYAFRLHLFSLPRLRFLYRLLRLFCPLRPQLRFVPVPPGHLVLHFDLGRFIDVRPAIDLRVNESERHFRHAGRLPVPRAGKDHIFHP